MLHTQTPLEKITARRAQYNPDRAFFIPAGYTLAIDDESLGVAIYHGLGIKYGKPCSIRFFGKYKKPREYYRYDSEEKRAEGDSKFMESSRACVNYREANKAEAKAKRATPHTLKEGDILVSSWGWEQTNVDFYQVIGLKGQFTVLLKEIGGKSVGCEGSSMSDMVMPVKDSFGDSKAIERRASVGNYIKINDCQQASLWEGRPMYRSWYA